MHIKIATCSEKVGQNRCIIEEAQKVPMLAVPVYVWSSWIKAAKVPRESYCQRKKGAVAGLT